MWPWNWTDKSEPSEEDLLFQVLFTATSAGSIDFVSGPADGIMLWDSAPRLPNNEVDYGRLTLGIGQDAEATGTDDATVDQWCIPNPEAQVRLEATDRFGNPVERVEVGDQFYLRAYVRDTRHGIPQGISIAQIDVAYDAALASVAGQIQYGERFPNGHSGSTSKAGVLDDVGGSLWNMNWTDKGDPGEEDLLFQVLFTATSSGSIEFLSGPALSNGSGIMLRDGLPDVPSREVDYGRLALGVGQDPDATGTDDVGSNLWCLPRPEARVRLQATDLSGNPVARVDVGEPFYLQAYVRDTRHGIPQGIVSAVIDVAYDVSLASVAGGIEYGARFLDYHIGDTSQAGLLNNVGASLWNVDWTDKDDPGEEDLLFQVMFTATSSGSMDFASGIAEAIMLRDGSPGLSPREVDYGRFTLGIGQDPVATDINDVSADRWCISRPEARIRLQATDLSGVPLTHVWVGDQFYLQAYVRDTRHGIPRGIAIAQVDVAYDATRASVAGQIEYGPRFPSGHFGSTNQAGLLDGIGGSLWNVDWTDKSDPSEEDLLFQVLFTATSTGSIDFVTGPALSNGSGILQRFGYPDVPSREVDYGQVSVTIEEVSTQLPVNVVWHNIENSFDVNADGKVAPNDVLMTINALNRQITHGVEAESNTEGFRGYLDVNNDGHLTPIDALLVINHLNANSSSAAGEGSYALPDSAFDASRSTYSITVSPTKAARSRRDGEIPESTEQLPPDHEALQRNNIAARDAAIDDVTIRELEVIDDELLSTLSDSLDV